MIEGVSCGESTGRRFRGPGRDRGEEELVAWFMTASAPIRMKQGGKHAQRATLVNMQ